MTRYLARRLAFALPALWLILSMVFLLSHIVPGDPVQQMLGEGARGEDLGQLRHSLGLDLPLPAQYARYFFGVLRGDLGESFRFQQPVARVVLSRYPATLELSIVALLVCAAIGIPAGVLAAHRRGTATDHAVGAFTLLGLSVPNFALGPVLILVFSVTLQWLPAIGNGSWRQLVLPVVCLGLITSGRLMRMVRSGVLDVLEEPFVMTLRGKGLRERQVLFTHVLRNALIPVVTVLGVLVGELLSGTVVVETLFARQGIGRMLVDALNVKDIPVVQGAVLLASIFFVLINMMVDLSYGWIDRRVRS